jgi:UDP-N-acetylglucosamine 2-epimerase (non-hydrolysing)
MEKKHFQVMCVVGARPNFMKIAPVLEAFGKYSTNISTTLLHTGQHYDHAMKTLLFEQLRIPVPDIDLEVQGGSHAVQTANIMLKFEEELIRNPPDAVLVVGDVNSTIACALVAVKMHIPVIHVEAGLRSGDLKMPEEINRLLTDRISQLLFVTEKLAIENLVREGVDNNCIKFVGNVMIDTLLKFKEMAPALPQTLDTYGIRHAEDKIKQAGDKYFFVTMHRPSNVDSPDTLSSLLNVITETAHHTPVVFAMHPRTRNNIEHFKLTDFFTSPNVFTTPPVGYLDSVALMSNAAAVLTDSGGIQEETTALGVPCITMRENTERWITVTEGTNTVVGNDPQKIKVAIDKVLAGKSKSGRCPPLWDGQAAMRIVIEVEKWLKAGKHALS